MGLCMVHATEGRRRLWSLNYAGVPGLARQLPTDSWARPVVLCVQRQLGTQPFCSPASQVHKPATVASSAVLAAPSGRGGR